MYVQQGTIVRCSIQWCGINAAMGCMAGLLDCDMHHGSKVLAAQHATVVEDVTPHHLWWSVLCMFAPSVPDYTKTCSTVNIIST